MSQSRQAIVTANVLKEYKEMITNTTSDLEEHLQEIDTRLQILCLRGAKISDEDGAERERVQEEKDSTRQCLDICAQVSEHINQVQLNVFKDVSATQDTQQMIVATLGSLVSAERVTANILKQCKEMLTNTTSKLEEHLQKNRLRTAEPLFTRRQDVG
jgi:ABC-type transporter Mla subunit MlaD